MNRVKKPVCVKMLSLFLAILMAFSVAVPAFAKNDAASNVNPYISTTGKAMVSAHRSGADIAPENTLMAFEHCVGSEDFEVDIFEFDLHITADGKLILLHDSTLDRTTDSAEHFGEQDVKPAEKTYAELRELNFGENFKDASGEYPFRGLRGDDIPLNLRAVLLEDVLDYLERDRHYRYIIEIKDSGENGKKAADELYRILKEKDLIKSVVFGTFNQSVTSYVDKNYPDMLRSAGIIEVLLFYFASLLNLKLNPASIKYEALQIPSNQYVIRLGTERVIEYAHKNNIAVQYWTINDPEEIKRLSSIGADAIMSDTPDVAYQVINS